MSETTPRPEPSFAIVFTNEFDKPSNYIPTKSPNESFLVFTTNIVFLLCLLCISSSSSIISGILGYSVK